MTAGPVMSTRMMPVPDLEKLEKEVSGMLNNLTDIRMEGSDLVLEGDGKTEYFVGCYYQFTFTNFLFILKY